jgi:hypothetical protein
MDPLRLRRPENEAVLAYLETEQLPSWRESDSPWIVDGLPALDASGLCERIEALAAAAGGTFGYLYGRPVVVADGGVVVAFGAGTHILCPAAAGGVRAGRRHAEAARAGGLRLDTRRPLGGRGGGRAGRSVDPIRLDRPRSS